MAVAEHGEVVEEPQDGAAVAELRRHGQEAPGQPRCGALPPSQRPASQLAAIAESADLRGHSPVRNNRDRALPGPAAPTPATHRPVPASVGLERGDQAAEPPRRRHGNASGLGRAGQAGNMAQRGRCHGDGA